jgi:hypothetical protein
VSPLVVALATSLNLLDRFAQLLHLLPNVSRGCRADIHPKRASIKTSGLQKASLRRADVSKSDKCIGISSMPELLLGVAKATQLAVYVAKQEMIGPIVA